jgi:Tfp pilus assembly protein PilV
MRKTESISSRLAGSRGVTLVETLVAATLLGLTFVGTTSMLASGRDLESEDYLHRQAFRLASNLLENPFYKPTRYPLLAAGTTSQLDSLKSESGQKITATVSVTVSAPTPVTFQDPTSQFSPGQTISYKKISVQVSWSFAGTPDNISLSNRIADIP